MIMRLYVWHKGEQFFIAFDYVFIYPNASQYDDNLFSFTLFSCLK